MSEITPLANPRGVKRLCELCQRPARLQCSHCRVTYYCDSDHQGADWVGIHEKVCQLLIPLRTAVPFHTLEVEREHHRAQTLQRQEQLIELSRATAQKKLFEGKHQEAVPAALLSLRCCVEIHGTSALQLVPSYLLLAEACTGLGNLTQAEEYLCRAEWTVLKNTECGRRLRHTLHRSLGLLHAAKGDLEGALEHLASDVYYASEEFGSDHIVTSGGYFHMANVFFRQNKMDIADSLYTEVTAIWHRHLSSLLEAHQRSASAPADPPLEHSLSEAQQAEAQQVLGAILDIREQAPRPDPTQTARAAHSLALLHFLGTNTPKVVEFGRKALRCSQLVPDCGLTEPIERLLQLAESRSA
uniref:Zinc finger MYND-type containing 12 n=1 Tax=Lepisosteus oculatus TaxID=7918 RepID=W5M060_LEPOC|nr:PREDICTED: zinc finger MYND domain-containing protein 12 [Lepisosteus oculatus]